MSELHNMDISGTGKIPGGKFANVNISGMGKLMGEISGIELNVAGMGKALNNTSFNFINIAGTFKSEGIVVSSERTVINGTATMHSFNGKNIEINGTTSINEGMKFDRIVINGKAKIVGNCEGRELICYGAINVGGLLSADKIEISLIGSCSAKEIGGEEIIIKDEKGAMVKFLGFSWNLKKTMKCEIIEGDKIYLENTICDVVRGENIVIGVGCKIKKVEYYRKLQIVEGSIVEENILLSK